jgi:hypothetical protein
MRRHTGEFKVKFNGMFTYLKCRLYRQTYVFLNENNYSFGKLIIRQSTLGITNTNCFRIKLCIFPSKYMYVFAVILGIK